MALDSPLEQSFVIDEMQFGPKPDKNFGQIATRLGPWSIKRLDILKTAVLKDGKELYQHRAPRQGDRVYGMSLLPGGRAIAGSAFDLYLLDLETNKILRHYRGHNGIVLCVSPSPDGKYFLSGSLDQTISLWDPEHAKSRWPRFSPWDASGSPGRRKATTPVRHMANA